MVLNIGLSLFHNIGQVGGGVFNAEVLTEALRKLSHMKQRELCMLCRDNVRS